MFGKKKKDEKVEKVEKVKLSQDALTLKVIALESRLNNLVQILQENCTGVQSYFLRQDLENYERQEPVRKYVEQMTGKGAVIEKQEEETEEEKVKKGKPLEEGKVVLRI